MGRGYPITGPLLSGSGRGLGGRPAPLAELLLRQIQRSVEEGTLSNSGSSACPGVATWRSGGRTVAHSADASVSKAEAAGKAHRQRTQQKSQWERQVRSEVEALRENRVPPPLLNALAKAYLGTLNQYFG